MNARTKTITDRMIKHPKAEDGAYGVVSSVCKDARVDDDGETNDVVVVITTDAVDLSNEVVLPGGMRMDYLLANRKVFADHEYDIEHTVGHLRLPPKPFPSAEAQKGWRCRVGMIPDNPLAMAIKSIIRHTGSIGASIGFKPVEVDTPTDEELERYSVGGKDISSIIRVADIFEFSFTSLPCNVDCQSKTAVFDDSLAESVERMVTMGVVDRASAFALGVPGVTEKRHIHPVPQIIQYLGDGISIISGK